MIIKILISIRILIGVGIQIRLEYFLNMLLKEFFKRSIALILPIAFAVSSPIQEAAVTKCATQRGRIVKARPFVQQIVDFGFCILSACFYFL